MDASVLVDLPPLQQRLQLAQLYLKEHVQTAVDRSLGHGHRQPKCEVEKAVLEEDCMRGIAKLIEGFSGRSISKLFVAAHHAMLLAPDRTLTLARMSAVVDAKVVEHRQKETFGLNSSNSSNNSSGGIVNSAAAGAPLSAQDSPAPSAFRDVLTPLPAAKAGKAGRAK